MKKMKKWYDEEYEFTVEVTGGKRRITRMILEALPDWFEVEESREEYKTLAGSM